MANYEDYLNQFSQPAAEGYLPVQPVSPTPEDAAAVEQSASDPTSNTLMNIGMDRGNDLATQNGIIQDFQNIPFWQFQQKYGPDISRQMGDISIGKRELTRMDNINRTPTARLGDAASGVTKGFVGGVADVGTFVAGALNKDAGIWAAQTTGEFRNFMDDNQSQSNQSNRYVSSLKGLLDSQDNENQYKADGEGFESSLAYLGRGLVNGASRMWEDPQTLEAGLSEGVGSLLAGGAIGKSVSLTAKLAGIGKAVTTAAVMPATIGAMEGGSAYSGAVNEVMDMDHNDLMSNSPTYKSLIDNGTDPIEAKKAVADRAGKIAGAIQAPIGALTGKLVAGFEANPIGGKTITELMKNILNETVEEGIQSATGQIAQNTGVQVADENRELLQNVGEQTAQGAILGSLTAATVQAPAVPKVLVKNALSALTKRSQEIQEANAAGSGVTEADIIANAKVASEAIQGVAEATDTLVEAMPENLRKETNADQFKERIIEASTITLDDVRSLGSETIKYFKENNTPNFNNRIDMMLHLGNAARTETAPREVRETAGIFLLQEMARQTKLFDEDIQQSLDNLDQNSDEYKTISTYNAILKESAVNPVIVEAMRWGLQKLKISVPETGPVSEQTVTNAIRATTVKPSAISPEGIRTILKQSDEGNINLTNEQRKALIASSSTHNIAEKAMIALNKANVIDDNANETSSVKDVTEQILTRGNDANQDWGLSVDQHIGRINNAMLKNNVKAANTSMRHFGNFALSQSNKAKAAIRSARNNGAKESYTRIGAYGQLNPVNGEIDISLNKPGAVAFARRVTLEANMLIDQVNELQKLYPEAALGRTLSKLELPVEFFGSNNIKTNKPVEAPKNEVTQEPVQSVKEPSTVETTSEVAIALDEAPAEQDDTIGLTSEITSDFLVDETKIEPKKEEEKSLSNLFPNLIGAKDKPNRFITAFKLNKNDTKKILFKEQPLVEFAEALSEVKSTVDFIGEDPKYDVTSDQRLALQEYLAKGYDLINDKTKVSLISRLATFARTKYNDKPDSKTFGDMIKEGRDIAGTVQGKAIALLEKTSNGYRYNPALVQTAMLAALDWYASSQNSESYLDKEDIAKITGVPINDISNEKVFEFNDGIGLTQVARALSDNIIQFWGVQKNKNIPENQIKGISEGIAKEIIEVMEANKFMVSGMISMPNGKNFKQFYFKDKVDGNVKTLLKDMGPAKKLIGLAVLSESNNFEATYQAPSKQVATKQMRNNFVENTKAQIRVIKKAQKIKFNYYRNSHDLQKAIGVDGWIALMGSTVINEKVPFNKEHLKSIEGKNLTIRNAFEEIENQFEEMQAYAEKANLSLEEIDKYYQFNYSRIDRLQMLGKVNPQSDKIARHVYLPTRTTINLENPNDVEGFFMAIAQGLGVKTQHYTPEENAELGRELVENGKFSSLVRDLQKWLNDGKKGSLTEWSKKVYAVDNSITEHGIMSLLSAAEYANALNDAYDKGVSIDKFITHNYFEADGVANGPSNALMNLSTQVSPQWIDIVRKGGAFIGYENRTMASQKNIPDLYATAGIKMGEIMNDFSSNLPNEVLPLFTSFTNIIQALGIKVEILSNGDFKINRNVIKNPATITIYGAGAKGISGNITDEIVSAFYEALSNHLQSGSTDVFGENLIINGQPYSAVDFWKDFKSIVGNSLNKNSDNEYFIKKSKNYNPNDNYLPSNKILTDLTLSSEEYNILKKNVSAMFSGHMVSAISDTIMVHVHETVDTVQKATNAQSIIMHFMFRKEIMKAMADRQINPAKYPDYKQGDFLSENELNDIIKSIIPFGAYIKTENQTFLLGAGERNDLLKRQAITIDNVEYKVGAPEEFSRSLTGSNSTSSYAFAPSIAGVGGIPSINVGTGDGRMMDIFIESLDDYGVLPVFDGINIPVNKIANTSMKANAAVMQTWLENPIKYVSESFEGFMRQNPLDVMLDKSDPFNFEIDALLKELTKNELGRETVDEVYDPETIKGTFDILNNNLKTTADTIQNRVDAMRELTMSVDQLAGGHTPFVQKGSVKLPVNASDAQIAYALELKMKQIKSAKTKEAVIQQKDYNFVKAFRAVATKDADANVMVSNIQGMNALRKVLNRTLPNNQREMLNASIENLKDSGLTIVFGAPHELNLYEQNNYPGSYSDNDGAYFGKFDVENNIIYISNPSAETLTHELLHAATITKMQGYYNDNNSVSKSDASAIQRLEGLMNEWIVQSFDDEAEPVSEAHRLAKSAILFHSNKGNKAAALNEFLAWSLTNQNIINLQKKTQVKNKFYTIMISALKVLKSLVWGEKKAPEIKDDIFSQVRFNARILMATPTPVSLFMKDFGEVVMYQSSSFGSNDRLSNLRKAFANQLANFIGNKKDIIGNKEKVAQFAERRNEALTALIKNQSIAQKIAVPFHMNMQEMGTFKMIAATMQVADQLSSVSIDRIQDIFEEVIKQITPDNFMFNTGDEGADRYQAQQKYDALTGINVTNFDSKGNSSLLTNFVALANVNEQFREILRTFKMPERIIEKSKNIDDVLDKIGASAAASLTQISTGETKNDVNFLAKIDALTNNLMTSVADERSFIEQRASEGFDNADNLIKSYIEKTASRVEKWADTLSSPIGQKAGKVIKLMARSTTEEGGKSISRAAIGLVNMENINFATREAVSEIIGRTEDNAPIFDMISRVRAFIDQTRQRWREDFPKQLKELFKRPLSSKDWSNLHSGLARTDASSLISTYKMDRTIELLSSGSDRLSEISSIENKLKGLTNWSKIQAKSKQLAQYMNTGDHGPQLHRNAYAIASILGALSNVNDIDNLVSLYALEGLPTDAKDTIANVIQDQKEAFIKLFASLNATRNDEFNKSYNIMGKMNHYKGHLKGTNEEGVHLLISDKKNHGALMNMDYTYLGEYKGSSSDIGNNKRGYYFAPVSGRAKFNQGVLQTVQTTQFGVDPTNGFTFGEVMAGRITEQSSVQAITRRINNQIATKENLLPIYDGNNIIVAYERAADPQKLTYLGETLDLAQGIGAWRGRQTEEISAQQVNKELVDKAYNVWRDGKSNNKRDEFIRLDKSTDPIIKDAWSILPKFTKDYIKSRFGDDGFMVRRTDVLDIVGARSASIGDVWTGNSRWSSGVQMGIRDVAIGFLGNKAFRVLTNFEEKFQSIITDAKVLIVVKSVIVPVANIISNFSQLSMNGVPVRNIINGMKEKTVLLNSYIQRREQERLIQNDLFVAEGANDTVNIRKLSTRLQTLRDSYKRMSIWPLIEAGEFSAITDGGITQEDLAISKGGYQKLVDNIINKTPDEIKDVARYAFITRDTSLFRMLSKSVQYGDFLAKAVLYDDLTQRKKMSQKEALAYVSEEFINYNRFAGRNRAYLESIGMTWFYNFKLRSMKVAQRMIHKHPVRALLHTALTPRIPVLGSVGNIITDNMLSIIMDGNVEYSIGPNMLFRAPQLNPWLALAE